MESVRHGRPLHRHLESARPLDSWDVARLRVPVLAAGFGRTDVPSTSSRELRAELGRRGRSSALISCDQSDLPCGRSRGGRVTHAASRGYHGGIRCGIDFRRTPGPRGGDRERDRPRRAHGSGRRLPGGIRRHCSPRCHVERPRTPARSAEQGKRNRCARFDCLGVDRRTTTAPAAHVCILDQLGGHRRRVPRHPRDRPSPIRPTARDRSRIFWGEFLRGKTHGCGCFGGRHAAAPSASDAACGLLSRRANDRAVRV